MVGLNLRLKARSHVARGRRLVARLNRVVRLRRHELKCHAVRKELVASPSPSPSPKKKLTEN